MCSNVCISAVKFPPFGTRVMADVKFDSALEFLLDEKEIPMEYKAKLLDIRINTMSKFAMLDETRAQIRSMLTTEWGFDPSKVPEARGNNASFIDAWETAVTRITKEREEAAVARASNLPRTIPSGDLLALRKAFKNNHFELKDELAPSDALVELRMEMIENGEQKAEPMGKITSKAWDDDPDVTSDLMKGGYIRVRKTGKEAPLPQSGEELRSRIKIWGISWIYAASKHSTRAALQDLDPQLFYDYADFLLGPRVRDLLAKDSGGNFLSRPPFSLVLSYEYQLRKRMAHLMNDGMSLKGAMKMAMECSETREVHFLTPLLFASIPASSGDHERERSRSPRRLARGDRGRRGKDKSKGSFSSGKGYAGNQKGEGKGWHAVTPDGRKICFNFNKRSGCPGHCGFVHVCRGCFGNRPFFNCCGLQASKGGGKSKDAPPAAGQ